MQPPTFLVLYDDNNDDTPFADRSPFSLASVLSFMSQWGGAHSQRSPTTSESATPPKSPMLPEQAVHSPIATYPQAGFESPPPSPSDPSQATSETLKRRVSRRGSMVMSYNPPMMSIDTDTPPELQPIFNHLNNHANKLYQEGYFLKLHDLDSREHHPSPQRAISIK